MSEVNLLQEQKNSQGKEVDVEALLGEYLDQEIPSPQETYANSFNDDDDSQVDDQRTGFKNPLVKAVGVIGVFFLLMMMFLRGCGGGQQSAETAEDKEKIALKQQNQELITELRKIRGNNEASTAKAQFDKFGKPIPPPDSKPKAPAKAKPVVVASTQAYRPAYAPSYYNPPRVVQSQSVPKSKTESNFTAPDPEVAILKAQLEAANRKQQTSPPQVTPEVVPEETPEVQNVSYEPEQTAIDGGWEEQALMSGISPEMIASGSTAEAVLDVPIIASTGVSPVSVTLKSDVKSDAGGIALPKGAQLMGSATVQGGVASLQFTSAVVNGQTKSIPQEYAQSVVAMHDKKPLVAKSLTPKNKLNVGSVLLKAGVDAGTAFAGQALSQATTTTQFSDGTLSQTSGGRNSFGDAAIAAGGSALQSVSGSLSQGLQTQMQNNAQPEIETMAINAGTSVSLKFMAKVPLLTAMTSPGVESVNQPLPTNELPLDTEQTPSEQIPVPTAEENSLVPPDAGQFIDPGAPEYAG
jgi:hypothetical protein